MADADPKIDQNEEKVAAANVIETVEAPAHPKRKRRWGRLALMLCLPLLLAAVAGYFWLTGGRYVSTDNAYVQQDMVSISPDVSGRIVQVNVRENQPVKKGDILFVIDPEPYRIALAQANAALAQARVNVATLTTDSGGAAADIASANADIQLAQVTYDRQIALMKRGFTTRASLDAASHELAAAKARLATAQASAAKARAQVGSGDSSGIPADVQAALANRDKALLNLQRTSVRATVDGIVSQTSRLQVGNVTPTGLPALSLVISKTPWVTANFKETDLKNMRVGQPAEMKFDAYPGVKLCGRVESVGAGTGSEFSILPAQNATGNWVKVTQRVPVRIAITCKTDRALIAGLSTDVTVDTKPNG